ncbi:MAG: hypothetical protein VX460_02805 [Planctomycetota bacterium]|nr:hypothetical protein [Planctomycetota bacterium]
MVTEGGATVTGECEIWALQEGAFDPRALLVVGRATGDRVETSRRVATWSGRARAGRADLPRAAGASVLVMARRGASYGEVEITPAAVCPVELAIHPRTALTARVVDGAGQPVAGVPVGLGLRELRGGVRDLPIAARTDADGLATLYGGADEAAKGAPLVACVRTATAERLVRPITPALEASFVLPDPASVEVRFDGGAAGGIEGIVQVFAAAEGSRSARALGSLVERGATEPIVVQGGVPLRAIIAVTDPEDRGVIAGRVSLEVGEVQPGETRRETIDLATWAEITARLRDGRGTLAPGTAVEVALAPSLRTTMRVVVGDEGRIRWLVPPGEIASGDALRVRAGRAGAEAALPPASGSRVDLGELELR